MSVTRISLVILLVFCDATRGGVTSLRDRVLSLVKDAPNLPAISDLIHRLDKDGRNILHHVVILGNLQWVEFLTSPKVVGHIRQRGLNRLTDKFDNNNETPEMYATRLAHKPSVKHMQVVSVMLEQRGVNVEDGLGWTSLMWSILAEDVSRITKLIGRGVDIEHRFTDRGGFGGKFPSFATSGRQNAIWLTEFMGNDEIIKIIADIIPDELIILLVKAGYKRLAKSMSDRGVSYDNEINKRRIRVGEWGERNNYRAKASESEECQFLFGFADPPPAIPHYKQVTPGWCLACLNGYRRCNLTTNPRLATVMEE